MKFTNEIDTVKAIIDSLKLNKRVVHLRYNDGDFYTMLPEYVGRMVGHSNKSLISEEMRKKVIEGYNIEDECYFVGTTLGNPHPHSTASNVSLQKVAQLNLTQHEKVYSSIAFMETFMEEPDLFIDFCKLINNKKTLYINQYCEPILEKFYGKIEHYIQVPGTNSTAIYKEVVETLSKLDSNSFDQIVLSAGFLTRVIAKDLWEMFPDKCIFDVGSVSDMIIVNEKSFSNIAKRGHIKDNMNLIKERVAYYDTAL